MLSFIEVYWCLINSCWRRNRTEKADILIYFQIYRNPVNVSLLLKVVFSLLCPESFTIILCSSRTSENIWKTVLFVVGFFLFVCLVNKESIMIKQILNPVKSRGLKSTAQELAFFVWIRNQWLKMYPFLSKGTVYKFILLTKHVKWTLSFFIRCWEILVIFFQTVSDKFKIRN